ncbi:hypothetical protein CVT25_008640 [Psilocybe cyanescens]|uniref:Uncharacterized protein n=1 Tax=Psilocybe cyanescens TaxID=93625 RepID=A0A409XNP7_PSICY|nr:hypothetical protein CVT25_008640 [Psilocybe cyanescens]
MPSFHTSENISFDASWEDLESDRVNPYVGNVLARNGTSRKQLRASQHTPKSERMIAGNKRVAKYRTIQGYKAGGGQVLQSITATPALKQSSFEELRVECYLQSFIAKGCSPSPVDPIKTPWNVIPPMYNAFVDTIEDEDDADLFLSDVIMKD